MNDVLMNVRITEFVKDGQVIRLKFEGKLAALGASYRNGFAIQLDGVDPTDIKGDSIELIVNNQREVYPVLESGQSHAVLIASNNLWSIVQPGEAGCNYFRVEEGCGTASRPSWSMIVPFITPVATASMPPKPYAPFIFATPGTYHGTTVTAATGDQPGRKLEVHLKNKAPSDAFDPGIFGLAEDASNLESQHLFQTADGIPWAIEIPIDWRHPKEGVSLLEAYPQFYGFATDSSGQTNPQWYLQQNADSALIYND